MAGGFLTKIMIGVLLFSMLIGFATLFMVEIGDDYGLDTGDLHIQELEQIQQPSDIDALIKSIKDSQEVADIGEESQDSAQLQGLTAAEEQKLGVFPVLKNAANVLLDIFVIPKFIIGTLISILLVSLSAALYYAFRGVMP